MVLMGSSGQEDAMDTAGRRILIADDDENIRAVFRTILENEGFEVVEASNGQEAIDAARSAQPDLLLLDIDMPGMDGYTVLLLMRADPLHRHIPVVVMTGRYTTGEYRKHSEELGAVLHLAKPIPKPDLLAAVEQALTEDRRRG